jgi:conjugal transfer mating pair stabilization protein TraN
VAGQPQLSCAAGYTLSGNQCTRQVSTTASITGYSCPSGFTVSGSSCTRTITDTIAGSAIYSCSADFTLSANTCSKTTTLPASPIYSCQPGGTLAGDKCTYVVTTTSDAIEKFSCDDPSARLTAGVLQGGRQTYVCCKETVNNQCGGLEALLK